MGAQCSQSARVAAGTSTARSVSAPLAEHSFDEEGPRAPGPEKQHYMAVTDCDRTYVVRLSYTLEVTRDGHTRSTGPLFTAPVSLRERC